MPRVYNKRDKSTPKDAIYVGRPTKYGNPFTHIKDKKTIAHFVVDSRLAAIEAFEGWFRAQPKLIEQAKQELSEKDLVCWCAPWGGCEAEDDPVCHAQVIMRIINRRI